MPLNIITSNRMETLLGELACVVKTPHHHPLVPEMIVVQSKGMQRWVAIELAKRFGVWANAIYPFPNAMVRRLFESVLPDLVQAADPFSREVLIWKIIGLLPGFLHQDAFTPLRHYLDSDSGGLKSFQLAQKIANTFDQYTIYRPDMLKRWESEKETDAEDAWQAILWREITAGTDGRHRGRLKEEFRRRLMIKQEKASGTPERILVFGISYLPQYHMDILGSIAGVTDVYLFLLSPTREYWSDIRSRREKALLSPGQAALRIEGNPLLASLGRLGREYSEMLIDLADVASTTKEIYEDPGEQSLLHAVQSDILNLSGADVSQEKRIIALNDLSVQIHSCHSPMREIEVLHDALLALFENLNGLTPRDIVVMTPDIETYAPYIDAVFDGVQDASMRIPYSIADRRLQSEGQVAALLLKILDLPESRFRVAAVFDLLSAGPVRKRFELDDEEIETLRNWIERSAIRWGLDEKSRTRLGLPQYRENSWCAGIDRLLLGFAMSDDDGQIFNGILPYESIEGSEARALGKLAEFLRRLAEAARTLTGLKTLSEWSEALRHLLSDFILADAQTDYELAMIHDLLSDLTESGRLGNFSGEVSLRVIRAWLSMRLDQEEGGYGFLSGGVTFCAMLPMRSIPFRVVALIGMSDGAFPRQTTPVGFDLVARRPRPGDRSAREEDRYMFLESMLSARDCLYISYVGQSLRDGSELPPSVLVSELLDAAGRGFAPENGEGIVERLVTSHRLQAFSRDYFNGRSKLFSYSAENCAALQEKRAELITSRAFLSKPLEAAPDETKEVSLDMLLRFFDNPSRFLLERKMSVRFEDAAVPLNDREPFSVDGLSLYGLKQELISTVIEGGDPRSKLPWARASGILPPAEHGKILFENACRDVLNFAGVVSGVLAGTNPLAPLQIDLRLANGILSGRLDGVWPRAMIRYRMAGLKAKDRIRAWIAHLVLNAAAQDPYPRETKLIMTNGVIGYHPVDNAAGCLETLLKLYRMGLSMPLRFFPESSLAYVEGAEDGLKKARAKWRDAHEDRLGEGRDAHYQVCFGGEDPFDEEFAAVAKAALEPLLRHQIQEKR
mgnify:CR=1 FL=1